MQPLQETLIPTIWSVWVIYWIVAAARTKETVRREPGWSRLSHTLPVLAGGAMLVKPNILGNALEMRFLPATATSLTAGTVLVALGLGFSVAARAWLGGNWSASVTLKKGHELIRSGPYRWVRHPIYTGLLVALLGTALAIGRWRALIGLAAMCAAIARKIVTEEQFMSEQFGEAYARYRAEVAALIPFVL